MEKSQALLVRTTPAPPVKQSTIRTSHVAVLTPHEAVPTSQTQPDRPHAPSRDQTQPDQPHAPQRDHSEQAEVFPPRPRLPPLSGQELLQHFPNSRLVVSPQRGSNSDTKASTSNSRDPGAGTSQFENFPVRDPEIGEKVRNPAHMKNKLRKTSRPTPAPETATKANQNKMRSSTQKSGPPSPIARLTARPSPNFHPITESTTSSLAPLRPQARPNVPISETELPLELGPDTSPDGNQGPRSTPLPDRQGQQAELDEEQELTRPGHNTISDEDQVDRPQLPDRQGQDTSQKPRPKLPNSKLSVLANNNDGVWFLEEKIPEAKNIVPNKREFLNRTLEQSAPKQTNEEFDDQGAVSIVEKSKKGERDRNSGKTFESTTFSTSRVEIHKSTTPSPSTSQDDDEDEDNGKLTFKAQDVLKGIRTKISMKQEADNDNIVVINKGLSSNSLDLEVVPVPNQPDSGPEEGKNEVDNSPASSPVVVIHGDTSNLSLIDEDIGSEADSSEDTSAVDLDETSSVNSLEPETRSNKNDNEMEIDLGEEDDKAARLVRARRRKLRQRAKALMNAMEAGDNKNEPFVVLPMHQVDPAMSINVDQMFDPKLHPGVKRISAYDFEGMLANNATISLSDNHIAKITRPVSELKLSIEGLANSMKLLSSSVKESTTEKILAAAGGNGLEESQSTILHLQDEIVKLTRVLESLKQPLTLRPDEIEASTKRAVSLPAVKEFGNKLLAEEEEEQQDQDENSSDLVKAEVAKPAQRQQEKPQPVLAVTTDSSPEKLQIIEVFNPAPDWFTSTPSLINKKKPPSDG